MKYELIDLQTYPQTGEHQKVIAYPSFPFEIVRGIDPLTYRDKNGHERHYHGYNDDRVNKKWIAFLESDAPEGIQQYFEIKQSFDVEVLIKYCLKIYRKFLEDELARIVAYQDEPHVQTNA